MHSEQARPATIPFASRFLEPIVRGEKDATLRLGVPYSVTSGDRVFLANADEDVEWAFAKVTHTFTAEAGEAREILGALDRNHSATKTDKPVTEILQPHYSEPVNADDAVQGICWEVIETFAAAPPAGCRDRGKE
jgi:hypothetical protein